MSVLYFNIIMYSIIIIVVNLNTLFLVSLFVIQSEAKNLGNTHVDAPEILRRYAPLDDKIIE